MVNGYLMALFLLGVIVDQVVCYTDYSNDSPTVSHCAHRATRVLSMLGRAWRTDHAVRAAVASRNRVELHIKLRTLQVTKNDD